MKNDMLQYEKVYQILKNKIECGLIPGGAKLPSRANLCEEFHTSEKTVRRAVAMLVQEGLVDSTQRKRPTVALHRALPGRTNPEALQKADATAANDVLKTGILLCYPANRRGIELCSQAEWATPEAIAAQMDPNKPTDFWRLSNRFWRFFIARNENELILRIVDSLGFSELDPLPGSLESKVGYRASLDKLIQTMKGGGSPEHVHFDNLFMLYDALLAREDAPPRYRVKPDSPLRVGAKGLEAQLRRAKERYSSVYLDLLGLIAVGRYRPGDRLPSHEALQKIYGVSVDTTVLAIQTLQAWGVVTTKRGQGIFVAMDLEGLKKIHIAPEQIASHVRRFLDSLELLSLTVEGVAAHAAAHASREDALRLRDRIDELWSGAYLHQLSPLVLLQFIVAHIQYDALRTVYAILEENYHFGRNIPHLINRVKSPGSCEIYRQCVEAVEFLLEGDSPRFAKRAAEMFQYTQRIVISECKQLGFWDAAMQVYDGAALWK